jgi:hypothetical protein
MIETIRCLWQEARRGMAERNTARSLDRSIRRLEAIERYAKRRGAIPEAARPERRRGSSRPAYARLWSLNR